jgi:tetratricopeptide (TPR) repeat protein
VNNLHDRTQIDLVDLREIVARQRALGRRLLWLFVLPFAISAAIVAMFFVLNARLADLEVLTRQLNIERYLQIDKNYALAIDQYEEIAKNTQSASILARLGVLYFQLDPKNADSAVQLLEKSASLDPGYWETYRNLAYIYTATGRTKEAIAAGQKALQLHKDDAITLNNMAWIYSRTDDTSVLNLDLAQQYAETALKLTGAGEKKSEILDTLAEVHIRKGGKDNRELALEYLRKAISLAPNWDAESYRHHLQSSFPEETP